MTTNDKSSVEELFLKIVELLKSPAFSVDSSFRALTQQKPYRDLIELGPNALTFCVSRLREGALFLVPAVLEIWQIRAEDLGLQLYASDNEVSARLIHEWEILNSIQWTADAAMAKSPSTLELAQQSSGQTQPVLGSFRFSSPMSPVSRAAEL
jgi:hypothetical protein